MNLLSNLEKFGLNNLHELDITQDDKPSKKREGAKKAEAVQLTEADFLMDKNINCPVCDKTFAIRAVTTTKLKRREPDFDLRPNFDYIDTVKYDVISCPRCGYSALGSTFQKIDPARIKLIKSEITPGFVPVDVPWMETYSYEFAAERYKLALICSMKKRAKVSEKAMVCLKLSWLRREQLKELMAAGSEADPNLIKDCKAEMNGFYKQAYEGFKKALATEIPPFFGMDTATVEYMIVNMAKYYKDYDDAYKLLGKLITSPNTNSRLKNKCLDLKEEISALMGGK